MILEKFFSETILKCQSCKSNGLFSEYITYDKLPPFIGSQNCKVLIVGHSPKVRTGSIISVTLDLNRNRKLKKYVVDEILNPLGINLEICYATNLVKCLTLEMPEDLIVEGKSFMEEVHNICLSHFVQEMEILKPKLIISLSETVADLLQKHYGTNNRVEKMQNIFAELKQLYINETIYPWIPVVHIPTPKVRAYYFPEQEIRLNELKIKVKSLLSS